MFQFVRPKWMHLPAGAIEHEPDRLCDYNIKFGTDSYLPVWRRSGKSCVPQVTNCWPPAKKKQTKKKGHFIIYAIMLCMVIVNRAC